MRVRSWQFHVSGALGGAAGFALMEVARATFPPTVGLQEIAALGLEFAAFGLAVGAALGMTEGLAQARPARAAYGLVLGLVLGAVGGLGGGAAGQIIFGLLPQPPSPPSTHSDVAIVLDASGSMDDQRFLFWVAQRGNDPKGLRKVAARKLVEQLGDRDRVTVVDFADNARVLVPLTPLASGGARRKVASAIGGVDVRGGTNLSAGLAAALGELTKNRQANNRQHLIFLTDGAGLFDPRVIEPAKRYGITVYTVGLGPEVDRRLLEEGIARPTGGRYFPVAQADQLWPIFETILVQDIRVDMASHDERVRGDDRLRIAFRVASWLAMGLLIGAGQGVRENTREDLFACSLGGALGGLVGGALFEPVSTSIRLADGLVGRGVAGVIVGAAIGGSMRFAQRHLVELRATRTTSLLELLPEKSTSLVESRARSGRTPAAGPAGIEAGGRGPKPSGLRGLVLQIKDSVEGREVAGPPRGAVAARTDALPVASAPAGPAAPPAKPHVRPAPTGPRRPLSFYASRYPGSRSTAIAMAYRSGHYTVEELAEHFGLPVSRVEEVLRSKGL
jgi:hypothetical protein